jgi:MFS family permease
MVLTDSGLLKPQLRNIISSRMIIFVAFFDLFIQFPIVAPYARDLGASASYVGVIMAAYSATNLIGNIVTGRLVDFLGRQTPIVIGAFITSIALLGYAASSTPLILLISRVVHGFASSSLTPGSFAMLGDSSPANRRASVMGRSGAFVAVAAVLGPPLAGIGKDYFGTDFVFVAGSILMAVAGLIFWILSVETINSDRRSDSLDFRKFFSNAGSSKILNRGLILACVSVLAFTIGLGGLVTQLPLALASLDLSSSVSGSVFMVYALAAMVMMVTPIRSLSDRYNRTLFLNIGLITMSTGIATIGLYPGIWGAFLGMTIYGVGFGILFPAATALVVDSTLIESRGFGFGIFYGVYSAGVVIGSLMSGILTDVYGDSSGIPFILSAGVVLAVSIPSFLSGFRIRT